MTSLDSAGDVLIAPEGLGDVAYVKLDGIVDCFIRSNAFLAAFPSLTLTAKLLPFRFVGQLSTMGQKGTLVSDHDPFV